MGPYDAGRLGLHPEPSSRAHARRLDEYQLSSVQHNIEVRLVPISSPCVTAAAMDNNLERLPFLLRNERCVKVGAILVNRGTEFPTLPQAQEGHSVNQITPV